MHEGSDGVSEGIETSAQREGAGAHQGGEESHGSPSCTRKGKEEAGDKAGEEGKRKKMGREVDRSKQ